MTTRRDLPPAGAIRAILFDKDGTLIDFHKSWGPLNRRAADMAARGDRALADRLLIAGGMDPETLIAAGDSLLAAASNREIAAAWIAAGSPFTLEELAPALDAAYATGAATAVPVTDLAGLFTRLKGRGLGLGIASSDSEGAVRATAEGFGLAALTDFLAGYDSGHGIKPGPGMVLGFCRTIGLPAREVAVVGDNLHDMEMGRAAGAGLVVGVRTGTGAPERLARVADTVLDSIADLEGLLDGR